MSEDASTISPQTVSVAEAVRLAQTYPDVALRTLFLELSHAQNDVPLGAADRPGAIAAAIRSRLGAGGHLHESTVQLPSPARKRPVTVVSN